VIVVITNIIAFPSGGLSPPELTMVPHDQIREESCVQLHDLNMS
jgi:hypothetical protein